MLNSLDTTKANGADGVSARIQKSAAPNVAPVLVKLFNLSIRALPTTLETSSIVCIPKASKHQCPSYNQQISLLPVLSKMLERHFHTLVSTHLARNHPLSNFQWGFQSGKSTETALLATTNEWFTHLEARKDICAIFFDLQKAFNSVPIVLSWLNCIHWTYRSLYPSLVMLIPDKQRTEGCHRGSIIRCSASYFWSPAGLGTWPVLTFSYVHR